MRLFDVLGQRRADALRYRLVVWSLKVVVFVARMTGLKGHVIADAEGDAGYYALGAHNCVVTAKGTVVHTGDRVGHDYW